MIIIYEYFLIASALLFIYLLAMLLFREYFDKKNDKILNIKTRGKRSWDKQGIYNRTESTPYLALNSLIKEYQVSPEDSLIDFGAGKGRVSIYLYHHYNISIKGIELNELTFDELLSNKNNYFSKYEKQFKKELSFEKEYAEKFQIEDKNNKFFFFNPFDVSIFEKVVENIIENANEHNKEVDIILYYPTKEYKRFLKTTEFTLHKRIWPKGSASPTEKIEIYRYKKG